MPRRNGHVDGAERSRDDERMSSERPSGTVTFLFTDIEGSTRAWEQHPETMRASLVEHDTVLRSSIEAHGGYVFSTGGDGFAAAFHRAGDAASAALEAQRALAAQTWPEPLRLMVRMGIHSGEAHERDGDYFGPVLNRTARIMQIGHGGQTLVSLAAEELLRHGQPPVDLIDLGEHRLRDLGRAERIFQLGHGQHPAIRSLDSYNANLPVILSSFVGRERETADLVDHLGRDRLVTLTGVGGMGKTRLALQVAAELVPVFADGVRFVELAGVEDPAAVAQVAASAFELQEVLGRSALETLVAYLRHRQALVVLDNCEHVIDSAAELVEAIVLGCPSVRVLATSREGLGVAGEQIVAVAPLSTVTEAADVGRTDRSSAVELFVDRARAVNAEFRLDGSNAEAVAQICARLDGMPLALELAAARIRMMSPRDLAARLDDRFALLTGRARRAVRRHQTLRTAIDWSFDLLDDAERMVLRRLGVFTGSFSLTAAEAVVTGDGIAESAVLDILGGLVDKSLVNVLATTGTRYRMLETVREYARERLVEGGELAAFEAAHARWFVTFAEEAGLGLRGPDQPRWAIEIEADIDNLRGAVDLLARTGDTAALVRLVAALAQFRERRPQFPVHLWAETALALPGADDHPGWADVVGIAAYGAYQLGEQARARDLFGAVEGRPLDGLTPFAAVMRAIVRYPIDELDGPFGRALDVARRRGTTYDVAWRRAVHEMMRTLADLPVDLESVAEARLGAEATGCPELIGIALAFEGYCLRTLDPTRAREKLERSIPMLQRCRTTYLLAIAWQGLTRLHLQLGDLTAGFAAALETVESLERSGERPSTYLTLEYLLPSLIAAGATEAAAVILGAVTAGPRYAGFTHDDETSEAALAIETQLGAGRAGELRARGAAMTFDELASFARRELRALAAR